MTVSTKRILNEFDKRYQEIGPKDIIKLSQNDNGIFNVIRGLHNESYSTLLWDDSEINFDYYLTYVTRHNNLLEGYIIKLQPHLKTRNELVTSFTAFICKKYGKSEPSEIFNTYQDQQRSLFERLGYWTYDDSLFEGYEGVNAEIAIKGQKGIIYVPFAKVPTKQEKTKKVTKKNKRKDEKTYVYIMHNRQNGYYKIGRSKNPKYREKTLQAQEPDVELIRKWHTSPEVETILHRKYKEKRLRGEWFELTSNDLVDIHDFVKIIIETMKMKNKGNS